MINDEKSWNNLECSHLIPIQRKNIIFPIAVLAADVINSVLL